MTLRQRRAAQRAAQKGFTLLDCIATVTIIGILYAVTMPKAAHFLDSLGVHGAVSDAFAVFSTARTAAVSSGTHASVDIDTARTTLIVRVGPDTILKRDLGLVHQVKIAATRTSTMFSPNGLGYGAGNLTLVVKRGGSVDSLFVSRLGRVRH